MRDDHGQVLVSLLAARHTNGLAGLLGPSARDQSNAETDRPASERNDAARTGAGFITALCLAEAHDESTFAQTAPENDNTRQALAALFGGARRNQQDNT